MLPLFKPFLSKTDKRRVAAAIAAAERRTTGEIHVHVAALPPPEEILEAARRFFPRLGLEKTAARNGVLILLSPSDKRFAIWGDSGIHQKAGQDLWETARAALAAGFAEGRYAEGLEACIARVADALAAHFPKDAGPEPNELSDEVSES